MAQSQTVVTRAFSQIRVDTRVSKAGKEYKVFVLKLIEGTELDIFLDAAQYGLIELVNPDKEK